MQVSYWLGESFENIDTARVLFDSQKYLESAFFCHLAVEKMLKALFMQRNSTLPPKTHNLLLLAERSGIVPELNNIQLDFLANLNLYQIEGRYPGDRELLYKQTPVKKFKDILEKTEVELEWYKQKFKSES